MKKTWGVKKIRELKNYHNRIQVSPSADLKKCLCRQQIVTHPIWDRLSFEEVTMDEMNVF